MADLTRRIGLFMSTDIPSQSRRASQSMESMASRSRAALGGMTRMFSRIGSGIDSIGSRYTSMAAGLATGAIGHKLATLDERFTRLGIAADASAEKVAEIKKQIYDAANSPDIRVDPGEITAGIETILEATGDLKYAENSIETLGKAIQATGATGADLGGLLSEFQKFGITDIDDINQSIDTLVLQGKQGAFTLGNFASQGSKIAAAYAATGRGGKEAVQEMGAIVQVARMATGSGDQAATAVENLLINLTNGGKQAKILKQLGVHVLDQDELKKGNAVMRSVPELMADIIKHADLMAKKHNTSATTILGGIFDAEAMRSMNAAIIDYQDGSFEGTLDKFPQMAGDGKTLAADSARAAGTANAAWTSLATAFEKVADSNLAPVLQDAADALNSLNPDDVDAVMQSLIYGAGAMAGLTLGAKAIRGIAGTVSAVRSMRGGAAGKDGMAGAAADMDFGPQKVIVTNWPNSLQRATPASPAGRQTIGRTPAQRSSPALAATSVQKVFVTNMGNSGGGLDADTEGDRDRNRRRGRGRAGRGGRLGRLGGMLGMADDVVGAAPAASGTGSSLLKSGGSMLRTGGRLAGRAFAPLGVVMGGVAIADAAANGDNEDLGGAIGNMGGALAGAAAGAAIGSVVPVVGTVIGGAIGGIIGGLGGEEIGGWIGGWFDDDEEEEKQTTETKSGGAALSQAAGAAIAPAGAALPAGGPAVGPNGSAAPPQEVAVTLKASPDLRGLLEGAAEKNGDLTKVSGDPGFFDIGGA